MDSSQAMLLVACGLSVLSVCAALCIAAMFLITRDDDPKWAPDSVRAPALSPSSSTSSLLRQIRTPTDSRGRPLGGLMRVGASSATAEQKKKYAIMMALYGGQKPKKKSK